MSGNSSTASTVVAFPAPKPREDDLERAQRRAAEYLAQIEASLGLRAGAFHAALRDGKDRPDAVRPAAEVAEIVATYVRLSAEDKSRCLEFIRTLRSPL